MSLMILPGEYREVEDEVGEEAESTSPRTSMTVLQPPISVLGDAL